MTSIAAGWAPGAAAVDGPPAAIDQPGPPLSVPLTTLRAALECSADLPRTAREPVLLVPGTWVDFKDWFKWSYAAALSRQGIAWCGLSLPQHNTGDIQIAAEYEVQAIRWMHQVSGLKVAIVGHSQGGMQPRWALRFWPDVRDMVADMIGLAPDNQGGSYFGLRQALAVSCSGVTPCPTTITQQLAGSAFITAMNSRQQMFPGISYSVIYSRTDGLVAPADAELHGPGSYSYTALQDICPANTATHVTDGSTDPVAWALALDAITHPGPAKSSRISPAVCQQALLPGLDAVTAASRTAIAVAHAGAAMASMPYANAEPALRCYVRAACTGTAAPSLTLDTHIEQQGDERSLVQAVVRVLEGGRRVPVGNVTVTFQGHAYRTDAAGRVQFSSHLDRGHGYPLRAERTGCNTATATIRRR